MVETKAITNQTITANLANQISIPKLDAAPASPIDGQVYYDNILKKNRQWSVAKNQWVTFGGGDPNPWWLVSKRHNWIDDNIMTIAARAILNASVAHFGQTITDLQDVGSSIPLEVQANADVDIGHNRKYSTGTTINTDVGERILLSMPAEAHPYPLIGGAQKHRLIDALWIYIQFKLAQTANTRFEFYATSGTAYDNAGTYPTTPMIGVRFTGTGNWILYSRNRAGAEQTGDTGVAGGTTAKQFLIILDTVTNTLKIYQDGSATALASIASPNFDAKESLAFVGTILRNLAASDMIVRVSEWAAGIRVAV